MFATLNTQDYSCLQNYFHNKSPVDKIHQCMIKSFRTNPAKKYIYEANYWLVMVDKQCSHVLLSVFDRGQNNLFYNLNFLLKMGCNQEVGCIISKSDRLFLSKWFFAKKKKQNRLNIMFSCYQKPVYINLHLFWATCCTSKTNWSIFNSLNRTKMINI